jgi:hypothetical protein
MAGRERLPVRLHAEVCLGGLAFRVRRRSGALFGRGGPGRRERR